MLPYCSPLAQAAAFTATVPSGSSVEQFPEPQRLITGPSDHRLAVGTHGKVEDAECMTGQGSNLLHARILPQHDLVLAVSVGTDKLVRVLGPRQVADLAAGVDLLDELALFRVPELDRSIGRSASRGEQMTLVRGPCDRFDRRSVFGEPIEWRVTQFVPYHQFVIVAPGRQLAVIDVPLETADFLLVTGETAEVVMRRAHVAMEYHVVAGSRGQDVVIPRERSHPVRVADHGSQSSTFLRIPNLHQTFARADGKMSALQKRSVKWTPLCCEGWGPGRSLLPVVSN